MRQAVLPVSGNQLRLVMQRVNVIGQRQRDDIGLQAINHRTRLLAGAAVGLLDADGVAGLGLPLFGEGRVEILVQLARRIVRDIEQRDLRCMNRVGGEQG